MAETIDKDSQFTEIEELIREHSDKLRYHQGFGSHADRVRALLRWYEEKATSALSNTKQFRDDMLTYFRALIIVLDMTGNASTHAEKGARLRGAIELLEHMVARLRRKDLEIMFSHFQWRDAFASDWPTRRLTDRIHELEAENATLKGAPGTLSDEAEGAPV
jgi:hypothetical protein